VWHPSKYAQLLSEKIKKHGARVWLVNTGWTGGAFGTGRRIPLAQTRAIIDAIHAGALSDATAQRDPTFGFEIITRCPGVPKEILTPRSAWANAKDYDLAASGLAELFRNNFRNYEAGASAEIKAAGPPAV
jgi:phosphoenolpyruvate carboxykinase (ATP)